MSFPIALQLYSVREDLEKDLEGTLRKVKALGYEGVEFAGLYQYKPEGMKRLLTEIGLSPVSAHVPFIDLMADPQGVIDVYAQIGCKYVAIPYLTPEYRPNAEKFSEVIEGAKVLGKAAKDRGLTLLYHNHDFEFEKINGQYALDILYNSVPFDLLQTQIDTCWVNVAGEDPAAYLQKYAGRSPVVHLKDFVMPGKRPEKMYELIGIQGDQRGTEVDAFDFRPLGMGVQNFPKILQACKVIGTQWVVVEQDRPSIGKTALECAEASLKYLATINS
jgi:sugar phosphate isomerase/epimerase